MKRPFLLFLPFLLFIAGAFVACEEVEEAGKYDNWVPRNEAFIDSIKGKTGDNIVASLEDAKLETHKDFIDIQIPLSGTEIMGYTAAKDCVPEDAPYNAEKDITFFTGLAESYIEVKPGMFAIFFPQDGHAPGITPDGVKKVIVKVKA